MAVENCNTIETCLDSVLQRIAGKWNDLNFLPVTAVLSELHSDFEQPIPLFYETVSRMQKATTKKVEERWQLISLQLNRITGNRECSGQGDGGFMNEFDQEVEERMDGDMSEDEPVVGSLKNFPQRATKEFYQWKVYISSLSLGDVGNSQLAWLLYATLGF